MKIMGKGYWQFDVIAVLLEMVIYLVLLTIGKSHQEAIVVVVGVLASYVLARVSLFYNSINAEKSAIRTAKQAIRKLFALMSKTYVLDKYLIDSEGTNAKARVVTVIGFNQVYRIDLKESVMDWIELYPDLAPMLEVSKKPVEERNESHRR